MTQARQRRPGRPRTISSARARRAASLLLAACLAAAPSPAEEPQADRDAEEAYEALEEMAAIVGFELAIVGRTRPPRPSAPAPVGIGSETVGNLLGRAFDRVEVYDADGRLERVVAVVRDDVATLHARLEALERRRILASFRGESQAAQEALSESEALALARDPTAPALDRQRALAALAHADSVAAVEVLRDAALEDKGDLARTAISALGRFADGPAAGAAQDALRELREDGAGDPVDVARAEAAFGLSPLLEAFLSADDPIARKNLVHAASQAAPGDALTDFYLAALEDPSSTVRTIAAVELMDAGSRVADSRVSDALERVASDDPIAGVRETATLALEVRAAGGRPAHEPAPPLPSGVGGRGSGGRLDDSGGVSLQASNADGS